MTEKKEDIGDWTFESVGRNYVKIYPKVSPHGITLTGSTKGTELIIPYLHRLVRITLHQTNSSYVSADSWGSVFIYKKAGKNKPQKHEEYIFGRDGGLDAWMTEIFGNGFEYEAGTYNIDILGADTNIIFPVIMIQKLSEK